MATIEEAAIKIRDLVRSAVSKREKDDDDRTSWTHRAPLHIETLFQAVAPPLTTELNESGISFKAKGETDQKTFVVAIHHSPRDSEPLWSKPPRLHIVADLKRLVWKVTFERGGKGKATELSDIPINDLNVNKFRDLLVDLAERSIERS
jgi:hypothetical protein